MIPLSLPWRGALEKKGEAAWPGCTRPPLHWFVSGDVLAFTPRAVPVERRPLTSSVLMLRVDLISTGLSEQVDRDFA